MKLSARNVLKGRVLQIVRGRTTGHVKLDVGGGTVITASITMEAIAEFYGVEVEIQPLVLSDGRPLQVCVPVLRSTGG
jgi:molybdopterin-binding protein